MKNWQWPHMASPWTCTCGSKGSPQCRVRRYAQGVAEAWWLPRRVMPCLLAGLLFLVFLFVLTLFVHAVLLLLHLRLILSCGIGSTCCRRLDWAAEPSLRRAVLTAGCACFCRSLCRLSSPPWGFSSPALRVGGPGLGGSSWGCLGGGGVEGAPRV